jgi:hypothetical protein
MNATLDVNHVLKSGEYTLYRTAVPIFDEHDEFDKEGKLKYRFDKRMLQVICNKANAVERETGTLPLIGLGHTQDDIPEDEQPTPIGFGRNLFVSKFGKSDKHAIYADLWVKKKIEKPDGKVVDGVEYAKTFPHRSIELWANDLTLPWIALLRQAPERNLGMLAYSKETFYSPQRQAVSCMGGKRLRYAKGVSDMADTMTVPDPSMTADPMVNPNIAEMPPEGYEQWAKCYEHGMKHHPMLKKYAAMMSGTNTHLPDVDTEGEELARMQKSNDALKVMRFQKELDDAKKEQTALAARVIELQHVNKLQRFSKELAALRDVENFVIDMDKELEEVSAMDETAFEKHKARIKRSYQKNPAGLTLPAPAVNGTEPTPDDFTKFMSENTDDIIRYMKAKGYAGDEAFLKSAQEYQALPVGDKLRFQKRK